MQYLIIGAGSLGTLFGYYLSLAGREVSLIVSARIRRQFSNGKKILIDPENQKRVIKRISIVKSNNYPFNFEDLVVIISTKAYSLPEIMEKYKEIFEKTNAVFLLQNGLGNEEIFHEKYPKHEIFRIITSNGALMEKPGIVRHTGKAYTYIGRVYPMTDIFLRDHEGLAKKFRPNAPPLINGKKRFSTEKEDAETRRNLLEATRNNKFVKDFIEALESVDLPVKISDNPLEMIWRKAIINIGINAFGALTHLHNGDLLKINGMRNVITKTVNEAVQIAIAERIALDPTTNYLEEVFNVIDATKANKNSMLQDLLKGRRTEIDYLNGRIVKLGKQYHIATPLNALLTTLIHGREFSLEQETKRKNRRKRKVKVRKNK